MSNQITEKRFTFIEAANAAGLTPKQLRNWLDRERGYGLVLDAEAERPGDGWRRFSIVDVLRIQYIGDLVEFCIQVKDAARIVEQKIVSEKLRLLMMYKNTPIDVILAAFKNSWLAVWRDRDRVLQAEIVPDLLLIKGGLLPSKFIVINLYLPAASVFERLGLDMDRPEYPITSYETITHEEFREFEQARVDSIKELMGLFEAMKEPGQFGLEQLKRFQELWTTVDHQMRVLSWLRPEPSDPEEGKETLDSPESELGRVAAPSVYDEGTKNHIIDEFLEHARLAKEKAKSKKGEKETE